jgi:hypothetical protein
MTFSVKAALNEQHTMSPRVWQNIMIIASAYILVVDNSGNQNTYIKQLLLQRKRKNLRDEEDCGR